MAKRENNGSIVSPGGPGIPPTTVTRDPRQPTRLGSDPLQPAAPFVDPSRVGDPAALRYAQDAEQRRRNQQPLPKYTTPVAGGPDVPIPMLNEQAAEGSTMAAQALMQRGSVPMPMPNLNSLVQQMGNEPALSTGAVAGGIVDGTAHQELPQPPRSGGLHAPPGLLPTDTLPEEATRDPAFQQGHGAMFAVNQPGLAAKYGVVRGRERLMPQQVAAAQPRPRGTAAPGTKLSPDTVAGLQALQQAQQAQQQQAGAAAKTSLEQEAQRGPAGNAGSTEKAMSEEERQKLLDGMDDLDLSRVKKAMFKDMLNNDQQRDIIESRLAPLDLSQLILEGRVTQVVPIRPGLFEPEYQSYSGEEDLIIKRMIGEEAGLTNSSDRYIMDKYQMMGFTVALRSFNRRPLPDYRDAAGNFDEKLFWKKYEIVSRLNYHMLSSMMVNWFWFDIRVRKLLRAEELGNG